MVLPIGAVEKMAPETIQDGLEGFQEDLAFGRCTGPLGGVGDLSFSRGGGYEEESEKNRGNSMEHVLSGIQ